MPETPANSENLSDAANTREAPITASSETQAPSSILNSNESQTQFAENLRPLESARPQANQQPEQVVALPPILQETQTPQTEVAKPVSADYIDKGAKTSSLTAVAITTFREWQGRLTAHYQRMKQGTSS